MKRIGYGKATLKILDSTEAMALAAAGDFQRTAQALLQRSDEINVLFAGAESQQAFHATLVAQPDMDWGRINAFAVDEFNAPDMPSEFTVCAQPMRDLYSKVPIKSTNILNHCAQDPEAERARYEALIAETTFHLACIGIGRSGHLALNEPLTTDFDDPALVRITEICEESKRQLEVDPNFQTLPKIPDQGITMTIPALMRPEHVICVVPYKTKAAVMQRLVATTEPTTKLPASILRKKERARIYLDNDSSALIQSWLRRGTVLVTM